MLSLEKTSQNLYIHLRRSCSYQSFFFKAIVAAILFHVGFRLLFTIETTPATFEEIYIEPSIVSAYFAPSCSKPTFYAYPDEQLKTPLFPVVDFGPSLLEDLFMTIDEMNSEVLIGSKTYNDCFDLENFR